MARRVSLDKSARSKTGTVKFKAKLPGDAAYKALIEALPQKIFLKDTNSVYISCNEKLAQGWGTDAAAMVGKTDYDLFPREIADKRRADDKRIIDSGKMEVSDVSNLQKGKLVREHVIKVPVKDARGKVIGILGIVSDTTEHKPQRFE
jgi:PAS domain S-box-containing protein